MLEVSQEGQAVPQPMLNTNPTPLQDPSPVPAAFVASTFVEQYYRTLGNAPHQLHRFYSQDSVFARLEPGDALSMDAESKLTVIGQVAIHAKLRDLAYKGCKALIDTIDFQDSIDGSVLVLIIGYISNNGGKPRPFTQSILLARQERGYYVRNDILRFIQRNQDKSGPVAATDAIQPGFVPVAETKTPSVSSENATSDVCSEGLKESFADTMEQVEEPESRQQSEPWQELNTKIDEIEVAKSPVEPTPAPEPTPSPAAKPASWAALFATSSSSAASTPSTPQISQPIGSPVGQNVSSPNPEYSAKTPDYSAHLFVQNLPDTSTEAEISSLFSAYGAVDCVDILPKRTMAFVIFQNSDGAHEALKAKTIMLQGRDLQVSARKPRSQFNNRARGRPGRGRHVARGRPSMKQDERQQQ